MPPKVRISKEKIIASAIQLIRKSGDEALNARNLAMAIGCSTQPIFSCFCSMEELRGEVIDAALNLHNDFLKEEMAKNEYPPFKASGMAYIRFAKREREIFKLLFMRDRTNEGTFGEDPETNMVVDIIMQSLKIDKKNARLFHLEMWVFVHGVASMIATSYFDIEEELISSMLSDVYQGLCNRFLERGK